MADDLLTTATVADWRQRALSGQLTDDQLRSWIKHCREGRVAASVTSAKSRARKAPPDVDSLINDLDSII